MEVRFSDLLGYEEGFHDGNVWGPFSFAVWSSLGINVRGKGALPFRGIFEFLMQLLKSTDYEVTKRDRGFFVEAKA